MIRIAISLLSLGALLSGCSQADAPKTPPISAAKVIEVKPMALPSTPVKTITGEQAQLNLVKQFDKDGDGRVSLQEMLAHAVAQQFGADRDNDHFLSPEEFHRGLGDFTLKDPSLVTLFSSIDSNKDGKLDEQELAAHVWPGIASLDTNHDGFIDVSETIAPARAKISSQ